MSYIFIFIFHKGSVEQQTYHHIGVQ